MKFDKVFVGATLLVTLAACGPTPPSATVHEVMIQTVAPQAQVLWDISSRATNDNGDPDGGALTDADWAMLTDASQKLRDAAVSIETTEGLQIARPEAKIQGEGQPGSLSAAQVQQLLERDPAGFTTHAKALDTAAQAWLAASTAKDAKLLFDASEGLDQICESCHLDFWYPDQKTR